MLICCIFINWTEENVSPCHSIKVRVPVKFLNTVCTVQWELQRDFSPGPKSSLYGHSLKVHAFKIMFNTLIPSYVCLNPDLCL